MLPHARGKKPAATDCPLITGECVAAGSIGRWEGPMGVSLVSSIGSGAAEGGSDWILKVAMRCSGESLSCG